MSYLFSNKKHGTFIERKGRDPNDQTLNPANFDTMSLGSMMSTSVRPGAGVSNNKRTSKPNPIYGYKIKSIRANT